MLHSGFGQIVEQSLQAGDVAVQRRRLDVEEIGHRAKGHAVGTVVVEDREPRGDDRVVVESSLAGHVTIVGLEPE